MSKPTIAGLAGPLNTIRGRFPDLSSPIAGLKCWIGSNPRLTHIDPRRLLELLERRGLDPCDLFLILDLLVDAGELRRGFAVLDPRMHVMARDGDDRECFESIESIPIALYDRDDEPFDTSNGEVIRVYPRSGS